MPSSVVPRQGGGFGARMTRHGRQIWLGTFESAEAAQAAVDRARSRKVTAPSGRRRPRRVRPPTMEVVGQLADAMPSNELRAFVLVAAWSGLRLSEVAALERRDVAVNDDGSATLHVRHGKGDKEGWSLLYGPGLEALLFAAGTRVAPGPMLVNSSGMPWNRKSVNKAWVKARDRVEGCGAMTFHVLRKAHATWLLDQGASDLDVAIQLRHIDSLGRPDPSLVREVYGFPAVDAALKRLRGLTPAMNQDQGPGA